MFVGVRKDWFLSLQRLSLPWEHPAPAIPTSRPLGSHPQASLTVNNRPPVQGTAANSVSLRDPGRVSPPGSHIPGLNRPLAVEVPAC